MFRKKKHTKVTCSSQVLSELMSNSTISSISVSEETDISTGQHRKEYTLVTIGLICDSIISGTFEDTKIFEIQQSLIKDIKRCDSMLILTMQYKNNHIKEINLIGRVFKVDVHVEELKLKIRLFIHK